MKPTTRAKTFKALSILLTYPTEDTQSSVSAIRDVLRNEGIVAGHELADVELFLEELEHGDLYDLQERYTLLFDRSRSLSLHMFEHIHGESRDRGQAMVDLASHYESHGFAVTARELPDFLPMFLEFLSVIPVHDAIASLDDPLAIIKVLEDRLRKRKSSYRSIFSAIRKASRGKIDPARLEAIESIPDTDPEDLEKLDREWEEASVGFGPGAAMNDCGSSNLMARLQAMTPDAKSPGAE